MRRLLIAAGLCVLGAAAGLPAPAAQQYPVRPVRLVAPFPPGGGTDILSRVIAVPMTEVLRQPVIVDNRPGAGGLLGAELVAHAERDGYTVTLVSASYAASCAYGKPTFDPIDGIDPIILIGTTGIVLAVHPSVPAKTTSEFIAHARANAGKLNYGSVGPGSQGHLLMELFKLDSKTHIVHVPYKGAGPALAATIAGEVQVTAIAAVPIVPHLKAGRLRALGVTTAKRFSMLPDVPPIADVLPGFDVLHWYGMWAPKGTPAAIVALWNREVARIMRSPEMVRQMGAEGLDAGGGPPRQFYDINKAAVQKWRRVIGEANIPRGG
jgi:tripartite-type tricarboxylate transporter receptor subunit TctC